MAILSLARATFVAENCCIFFDKMCEIFQFIGEFWLVKSQNKVTKKLYLRVSYDFRCKNKIGYNFET